MEIGANIGLFTLIAADVVGPTGHVYGFEPSSRIFERLLANIRLNGFKNVSRHQIAVGTQEGVATLTTPIDGFAAWSSLAHPIAGNRFATETVRTRSWDQFARDHNLAGRVTMMKIDVEGLETQVLSGGIESLSRQDAPVVVRQKSARGASPHARSAATTGQGDQAGTASSLACTTVPLRRSRQHNRIAADMKFLKNATHEISKDLQHSAMNILTRAGERANERPLLRFLEGVEALPPKGNFLWPALSCPGK